MDKRETEFMEDPIWFSPCNVLFHAEVLKKVLSETEQRSKRFRKVIEAEATARMLIGFSVIDTRHYWMQLVDDSQGSPDIKSLCYADDVHSTFDFLKTQDIEVVEYEDHSSVNIPDFLKKTKLSSKKLYDKYTHILCHVGGSAVVNLPSEGILKQQMAWCKASASVIFLGAKTDAPTTYVLVQLHPKIKVLAEFDLALEFKNRFAKELKVMRFSRGKRAPLTINAEEKHYPFEKLGYVPGPDGKYLAR